MADSFAVDTTKRRGRDSVFSVRLDPADAERLRVMAAKAELSVSAVIRQMVEFSLRSSDGN